MFKITYKRIIGGCCYTIILLVYNKLYLHITNSQGESELSKHSNIENFEGFVEIVDRKVGYNSRYLYPLG